MLSSAAGESIKPTETQQFTRKTGDIASKKIWLPKILYDILPVFYVTSGIVALMATLYINAWFWVLPHYLLFSAACAHLGVAIYRRRNSRGIDSNQG